MHLKEGNKDENDEDKRDIEIAKTRLKQIDADPKSLVSGVELDEELDKLLA